jgi:hypothetical protein
MEAIRTFMVSGSGNASEAVGSQSELQMSRWWIAPDLSRRVFRAFEETGTGYGRVAACKVVDLFINPAAGVGAPNHKELQKEVQVHKSLKHEYILEFIANELVEEQSGYIPGLYMLLELAIGGDLFDKIGEITC